MFWLNCLISNLKIFRFTCFFLIIFYFGFKLFFYIYFFIYFIILILGMYWALNRHSDIRLQSNSFSKIERHWSGLFLLWRFEQFTHIVYLFYPTKVSLLYGILFCIFLIFSICVFCNKNQYALQYRNLLLGKITWSWH